MLSGQLEIQMDVHIERRVISSTVWHAVVIKIIWVICPEKALTIHSAGSK